MKLSRFYAEDFYKIEGQTLMHKFMNNPEKIEKLIDSYWEQRPMLLLTILSQQSILKAETHQVKQKRQQTIRSSQRRSFTLSGQQQFNMRNSSFLKMQDKVSVTYGKSALEAQLELSSDKLINKILFYLA